MYMHVHPFEIRDAKIMFFGCTTLFIATTQSMSFKSSTVFMTMACSSGATQIVIVADTKRGGTYQHFQDNRETKTQVQ